MSTVTKTQNSGEINLVDTLQEEIHIEDVGFSVTGESVNHGRARSMSGMGESMSHGRQEDARRTIPAAARANPDLQLTEHTNGHED